MGGISPLGQKKCLPTVIDISAIQYPTIFISGGKRGLASKDLVKLTQGELAEIAVIS